MTDQLLVIVHYTEGSIGFPQVYVSAPGAIVLAVDDNAPDDRVFRMETRGIPSDLLKSIEHEPVRFLGDDEDKDAQARRFVAVMHGGKPILTVLPGGVPHDA